MSALRCGVRGVPFDHVREQVFLSSPQGCDAEKSLIEEIAMKANLN